MKKKVTPNPKVDAEKLADERARSIVASCAESLPAVAYLSDDDKIILRGICHEDAFLDAIEGLIREYLISARAQRGELKPGAKSEALKKLSDCIVALERAIDSLDIQTRAVLNVPGLKPGTSRVITYQVKDDLKTLHAAARVAYQSNIGITRPRGKPERYAKSRIEEIFGRFGLSVSSDDSGNAAKCMRIVLGDPEAGCGHYFKPSRKR